MKKCLNCEEETFGDFEQCFIGPAISKQCSHCGKNISTPYVSLLLADLAFALAFIAIAFLPQPMACFIVFLILTILIHVYWKYMPLTVKKS